MLSALAYLACVICSVVQSALGKALKPGERADVFNRSKIFAAALMFLIAGCFGMEFHPATVGFGAAYGVFLAVSMTAGLAALRSGPMALTSMIVSFSLIVPMLYGTLFLNESLTPAGGAGFILLALSFVLLRRPQPGKLRLTRRWLLYTMATLLTNGFCSVVQKQHQTLFPDKYRTEFMLAAMTTAFVLLLLPAAWHNFSDRKKHACPMIPPQFNLKGFLAGIANGAANYLTLYLAAGENAAVLFPVLSAATAAASLVTGKIVFHESLNKTQLAGFFAGVLSVFLFKL